MPGLPKLLRQADLTELGISRSRQNTRHMQIHYGFPLGRLLGPHTRVWTEEEVAAWFNSRKPTAREMLDGRAA